MVSFTDFKKSRSDQFTKLSQKIQEMNKGSYQNDDDRFWQPTVDKAGNGFAIIRFLPETAGEEMPFIRFWTHGFQGPGGAWYIENSLTTIGKPDPVSEYNSELWNSGRKEDKDVVSGLPPRGSEKGKNGTKRRMTYIANIFVVDDPAKPENNGKVFLYRFGPKIYAKLDDLMNPKFPDEKPANPFSLWDGANLKLKIRKVEGQRNYDSSEFDKVAPLSEDDDVLKKIWEAEYSLQELLDEKHFKSYDELKAKLLRVMGGAAGKTKTVEAEAPVPTFKKLEPALAASAPAKSEALPWEEESDDELAAFKALAEK